MSVGPARLREEADVIRHGCIAKGEDPALVDQALVVDAQRRDLLGKADALRNQRNQLSESIGLAIRGGAATNGPQVAQLREQSTWIGAELAGLDARLAEVTAELDELLYRIPNPPDPGVPVGGEEASVIVRTWGEPLTRTRSHSTATARPGCASRTGRSPSALGIIDLAAGAKVTGSGLPLLSRARARPCSGRSSTSSSTSIPASTA